MSRTSPLRVAGAYHRAYSLARRGDPTSALKIIDSAMAHSELRAGGPISTLQLRMLRIKWRLYCWSDQEYGMEGRQGLLELHRILGEQMTEDDWIGDTAASRLMADLLVDLAAVGAHDEAISCAERLLDANVSEARIAQRKTLLAKLLDARGLELELASRPGEAEVAYAAARLHASESHSENSRLDRPAHAMDAEKQFIRARLGLCRVRGTEYRHGISHAGALLRSTLEDGSMAMDEQIERIVLLAHTHQHRSKVDGDGTSLRRAAYYYAATWNHALGRYLDPLQAIGIVKSFQSVGQAERAARCAAQAMRKLSFQLGINHSSITTLQALGASA